MRSAPVPAAPHAITGGSPMTRFLQGAAVAALAALRGRCVRRGRAGGRLARPRLQAPGPDRQVALPLGLQGQVGGSLFLPERQHAGLHDPGLRVPRQHLRLSRDGRRDPRRQREGVLTRFEGTDSYVATADLMLAVNAAVTLGRPLLVKGEPGTGKTQLAEEVARALERPLYRVAHQVHHQGAARAVRVRRRLAPARLAARRRARARHRATTSCKGMLWEAFDSERRSRCC